MLLALCTLRIGLCNTSFYRPGCILTAGDDHVNSGRFPDEIVGRCFRIDGYNWRLRLVIIDQSDQSESDGTTKLSRIFNVRCGDDTFVHDTI